MDLRELANGQELDHAPSTPVTRTPACARYRRLRFTITAVRPSSARALLSGPASSARPATSRRGDGEHELLRSGIVAADERVLVWRCGAERRGSDRVQARDDRRVDDVLDPLGQAEAVGVRKRTDALAGPMIALATESSGVEPSGPATPRAVSSAPSAFTASTTRSTPRTASSFVAPVAPSHRARVQLRPRLDRRRASRSRRRLRRPRGARRERPAEAAGAAEHRDPHAGAPAASSTAAANRRAASASCISVCATTTRTATRPIRFYVCLVDHERVDQTRRNTLRREPGVVPPASRASIRSAGPLTARPPISGLTATHGTVRRSSALRISATARIGPIETYGLLGATSSTSAASSASTTPGARAASGAPA